MDCRGGREEGRERDGQKFGNGLFSSSSFRLAALLPPPSCFARGFVSLPRFFSPAPSPLLLHQRRKWPNLTDPGAKVASLLCGEN